MESVSDSLVTNMHMCSPLEVVSSGSDSVPPAPSHTKEQMPNLLLGWCPSTVLFSSCYSLSPVVSWYHTLWNWGTEKTLCRHIWECLCYWRSWSSCAASIGCRFQATSSNEKRNDRKISLGEKGESYSLWPPPAKQPKQVKWIHNVSWLDRVISLKVNKLCYTVKMVCFL